MRLRLAFRSAVRNACAGALLLGSTTAFAQQPTWQPQRLPANSAASQLPQASNLRPQAASTAQVASSDSEQLGAGVVLRWKKPNSSGSASEAGNPLAASASADRGATSLRQQAFQPPTSEQSTTMSARAAFQNSEVRQASGSEPERISSGNANPLRSDGWVRTTNYQQQPDGQQFDPFGADLPALPGAQSGENLQNGLPELPSLPGENLIPSAQALDPLAMPEQAPAPNSVFDPRRPINPFANDPPRADANGWQDPSPFDRNPKPESLALPGELEGDTRQELDAPKRNKSGANSISCDEQRNRAKDLPLRDISLDVSPAYGEGLRSILKDTEKERLDFAASSEVRDWSDYTGMIVATGRLVDLRDDRVILDANGSERALLLQDLSDVDVAYVGTSWNIPTTCGTGYERFVGRNFTPSTVQWTASGLANKPLYFEQVQLERYGHEAGPIVQPIVSTAHFFGNIAILPYKMGIHPPNECQYSLGYIRPGNCAPYMIQPIPWSLRGAIMQAGAVTGAAALIP